MDSINAIAQRHGLWVVEDAAEAHGARYKGRPAGSLGSLATFSFYGNKIVTSGEGGAITVDDPELEQRLRLFRGQGMDPQRRYFFPVIGYNYRLTNLACALICAQMQRFDELANTRARVCEAYEAGLAEVPGIGFQPQADWAASARWMFCVTIDAKAFGMSRDELAVFLENNGIETRPFFYPIHRLPPYANQSVAGPSLPITDQLGSTGMNLPTSSTMDLVDVERVVTAIRAAHHAGRR
jgi:perosamine synthetase